MSAGDAFRKRALDEKVGVDDGVRVGMVWENVEEALSRGGDRVNVVEVSSFQGGGLAPDAIILCI